MTLPERRQVWTEQKSDDFLARKGIESRDPARSGGMHILNLLCERTTKTADPFWGTAFFALVMVLSVERVQ